MSTDPEEWQMLLMKGPETNPRVRIDGRGVKSEVLEFRSRSEWRLWLEAHHATTTGVVLVIQKAKHRGCGLALDCAVEEALCFGWIDSTLWSLDDERYLLRFTPRRRNSIWSIRNIRRVERLIREGRVTSAGMQKVSEAKKGGAWAAAARREEVDRIPDELARALRRRKGAVAGYRALSNTRRKQLVHWLCTAKRDATRVSRINAIVEEVLVGSPQVQ